jgi:hypothetical protein
MKHLLILLCMSTLVSCGIKNKFLNSSSGTLGVPKQPTEENSTTELIFITEDTESKTSPSQPDEVVANPVDEVKESFFKWYYAVPFVGLAILAFLVYRLKQQNLKSL